MLYLVEVLIYDIIEERDLIKEYYLKHEREPLFGFRVYVTHRYQAEVKGFILSSRPVEKIPDGLNPIDKLIDIESSLFSKPTADLLNRTANYYKVSKHALMLLVAPFPKKKTGERSGELCYEVILPSPKVLLPANEYKVFEKIKKNNPISIVGFGHKTVVERLIKKGFVRRVYREINIEGLSEIKAYALSAEEKEAVRRISKCEKDTLLFGSNNLKLRNEVLIEVIRNELEKGGSALFLFPYLARSNPIISLFKSVFGDKLFVFDSSIGASDLEQQQKRIKGLSGIVVMGVKEAVFLDIENLSLVIIDEEESPSYKNKDVPRIHFKRVAMSRGVKTILCSSSFSIESMARHKRGYYDLVKLDDDKPHSFKVLDLNKAEQLEEKSIMITHELKEAIDRVIKNGKQVLIYYPRRGYASNYRCNSCFKDARCPNCGNLLTYYKDNSRLVCLSCGYKKNARDLSCPSCGSSDFIPLGYGTMRLVEELESIFQDSRISRLDYDSIIDQDYADNFSLFALGQSDILVGTKMIASSLNFTNIGLVAAIDIDGFLLSKSYYAEEDMYGTLSGLASMLDRNNSEAYLLTRYQDNASIKILAKQDYDEFYEYAIDKRRLTNDPPYVFLVKLSFIASTISEADALSAKLKSFILRRLEGKRIALIGPSTARINQRIGKPESKLILKYKVREDIEELLDELMTMKLPSSTKLEIDVDPLEE